MKRLLSLSVLSLALAAGAVNAAPLLVEVPQNVEPPQSQLTRAEVLAEFHLWRLAGLQDLTRGEASVDTNSYAYRKAYATYVQMRQSPQFAQLVHELEEHPNASVAAVPSRAPVQASR